MGQATVCAQDVVGPGAHIPDVLVHVPCAAILQTWIVPWDEGATNVLQAFLCQGYFNPLVPIPDQWCVQVGVEIADHHQRGPLGPIDNGRNDVLYG